MITSLDVAFIFSRLWFEYFCLFGPSLGITWFSEGTAGMGGGGGD